jgi:SAM-dependent methyltransferase
MHNWKCWTYFDLVLGNPKWENLSILDFGGGYGNLLRDENSNIPHKNYYCIEIDKEYIDLGKAEYPNAHWIYYDRWNMQYNPFGVRNLKVPLLEKKFDLILAYSVFTHVSEFEMTSIVIEDLLPQLKANGKLVFTFNVFEHLEHILKKYSKLEAEAINSFVTNSNEFANGFYLLNYLQMCGIETKINEISEETSLTTFYKPAYLMKLFKNFRLKIIESKNNKQWALIIEN